MDIIRTPEARAATATPLQKVTSESRGSATRKLLVIPMLLAGVGLPMGYYWMKYGSSVKAEEIVVTKENFTGEELASRVRLAPKPEVKEERQPDATPAVTATAQPAAPEIQEPDKKWEPTVDWMRQRTAESMVAVAPEPLPAAAPATEGTGGPRTRHVPRGTVMLGLLENRILTDNLDSRVRIRLIEDYSLGSEIILPRGGFFVGEVASVASRYQKRVAVHISSYVYPDMEREVAFEGVALNPDESAHLLADDTHHHTGKLITGVVALELLRSATGYLAGRGAGNDVVMSFGNGVAGTAQSVVEPQLQTILQIAPTLEVEPGKQVYVFVDQSFDVPAFRDLPSQYAVPATAPPSPTLTPGVPDPMQLLAQLQALMASAPLQPGMAPGGSMTPRTLPMSSGLPPGGSRVP